MAYISGAVTRCTDREVRGIRYGERAAIAGGDRREVGINVADRLVRVARLYPSATPRRACAGRGVRDVRGAIGQGYYRHDLRPSGSDVKQSGYSKCYNRNIPVH